MSRSRIVLATAALVAAVVGGVLLLRGEGDRSVAEPGPDRGAPNQTLIRLRDVAAERGLRFRHGAFRFGPSADPAAMIGGGLCWLDYDDDGWLDLFVVNGYAEADRGRWTLEGGDLPTSRLFRNVEGRFTDVTQTTGAGLAVRGQGCVAADLDLDGHTDLFVTTPSSAGCCGTTATGASPRERRRPASMRSAGTPEPRSATSTATDGRTSS